MVSRAYRRNSSSWVLPIVFALVVGLAGSARADEKRAQALFDEGIRLLRQGKFAEACPKFEDSLALFEGVGTRGKLAECWAKQGRLASAYNLYREVERLAGKMGNQRRERVARQRADELESRIPRLTISPGPSLTLSGFVIKRNTMQVEPRNYGTAVPLDPGKYIITATASGYRTWRKKLRLGEGETRQIIIPALVKASDVDSASRWTTGRIAGLALVGVGAVSLVGGTGYFGLTARSRWNQATEMGCIDGGPTGRLECPPEQKKLADDADKYADWANISAGVGLVAITAGAILWWLSGTGDSPGEEAFQLSPRASPHGVGVTVWRRF